MAHSKTTIALAVLLGLGMAACSSTPKGSTSVIARSGNPDNQTMPHLITDYAGMKETPLVAFAWADSAFRLDECSDVRIQPVENLTSFSFPQAQERIQAALQESLAERAKNPSGRHLVATAGITGMRGKPGFIKRFSPTYEDTPSIEMELAITESGSGRELMKLCHMERGKDTAQALDELIHALKLYFKKMH